MNPLALSLPHVESFLLFRINWRIWKLMKHIGLQILSVTSIHLYCEPSSLTLPNVESSDMYLLEIFYMIRETKVLI